MLQRLICIVFYLFILELRRILTLIHKKQLKDYIDSSSSNSSITVASTVCIDIIKF